MLKDVLELLGSIALISLVITLHEFGHYIAARIAGLRVEAFSVGVGPVMLRIEPVDGAWTLAIGTRWRFRLFAHDPHLTQFTTWRIGLLPIAGYTRITGASLIDERPDPEDTGNFLNASVGTRAAVLLAGPISSVLVGLLILVVMALSARTPILEMLRATWNVAVVTVADIFFLRRWSILEDHGAPLLATLFARLAHISIAVGVVNMFPILPLDGGRIAILLVEGIRRRRISERMALYFTGLSLLLLVVATITRIVR